MEAAEIQVAPTPEKPPVERPPQPMVQWILGVSLVTGLAADGLLRALPLGINAPLVVGLLCASLIWAWQRQSEQAPCRPLLAIALVLSLSLAWRDAPVLCGLDVTAIIALMVVLGARPTLGDLHADTLASLALNILRAAGRAVKAPFLLIFQETDWTLALHGPGTRNRQSVLRGLLISVPTLLVFIWLFAMADAVFKHMIETFLDHVSHYCQRAALHVFWTLLFSGTILAVLRPATLGKKWERLHVTPNKKWLPGQIELVMVMGSILALFLAFIVVQLRYLFGGHNLVRRVPGLTYATYARKGFFALLFIVLLVHVVLLLGAWLVRGTDRRIQTLYRSLSLGLVALTAFIFASAFFRLNLYIDAYGLTQSRLYAAAVLVWLALVFVVLVVKIVFPGWRFFTGAYVYSFLAVLLLVNVANPDAIIARINLDRVATERPLDKAYLQTLSTDAVPTILNHPRRLSDHERNALVSHIIENRIPVTADWRSWNYSRAKAQRVVTEKIGAN